MTNVGDVQPGKRHPALQHLEGTWLCLDFVNTVDLRLSLRQENLTSYTDLVRWSQHVAIAGEQEAHRLLQEAARRPSAAVTAFEHALAVREAMYVVFSAVTQGQRPDAPALEVLNLALAEATVPMRLVLTQTGFERAWLDDKGKLDWILDPVVRSAADLLTSPELRRVKACPGSPGKACGWLFVDTSKNQSRQWCVGGLCGNRARVQRHYVRKHTT